MTILTTGTAIELVYSKNIYIGSAGHKDTRNTITSVIISNCNFAAATLKKHPESEVSYSFITEIDPDDGQILLSMPNELTTTIPSGRYFYDIVITNINDGYRSRVIEGMAMVTPGIT